MNLFYAHPILFFLTFLSFAFFYSPYFILKSKSTKHTKNGICLPKRQNILKQRKNDSEAISAYKILNYFRKALPRPHGIVQGARKHYHFKQREEAIVWSSLFHFC